MVQIAQAMEVIHEITGQNVIESRQAELAAEELNELARQLLQLIERYQV